MKNKKALLVFSGGQDSTTCLFWAKNNFKDVVLVSFDYNQKHSLELVCAKNISRELNCEHHILDMKLLGQLAPNALTRNDLDIKEGDNGAPPNTFVDGRNMLFLTFAAVLAKQLGIKDIITGVCETDFSGYPDCRDIFMKSLNVTLNLAMDYNFVIHTPIMWINKEETWKMADEMGKMDYIREKTLTCYNGVIGDGCGQCPSCILRNNGLKNYLKSKENRGV